METSVIWVQAPPRLPHHHLRRCRLIAPPYGSWSLTCVDSFELWPISSEWERVRYPVEGRVRNCRPRLASVRSCPARSPVRPLLVPVGQPRRVRPLPRTPRPPSKGRRTKWEEEEEEPSSWSASNHHHSLFPNDDPLDDWLAFLDVEASVANRTYSRVQASVLNLSSSTNHTLFFPFQNFPPVPKISATSFYSDRRRLFPPCHDSFHFCPLP